MQDPWVIAHELSLTREHDDMGLVTTCGPAPRLSGTPMHIGKPAPRPGSDAHSILAEIGLADRLESLIARGWCGSTACLRDSSLGLQRYHG